MILDNKVAPPLYGGHSTKINGTRTLKHEISSPKLYDSSSRQNSKNTLIWTSITFTTTSRHVNTATRLREYLIPYYQSIKRHYDFEEYFIPDCDHHYYSWNFHIYNSLLHSLQVVMANDTCVNPSWHLSPTRLSALMLMKS